MSIVKVGVSIVGVLPYINVTVSLMHRFCRIPNARTKEYLESLWTEINNKGVESNELLKQAYKKRLRELEGEEK